MQVYLGTLSLTRKLSRIFGYLKPNQQEYMGKLSLTSREAIIFEQLKPDEQGAKNIW